MAQCPGCFNEVQISEQHFGTLFTCGHCGKVFFIDWSGQPEVAQSQAYQGDPSPIIETAYQDNPSNVNQFESPLFESNQSESSSFEAAPFESAPFESNSFESNSAEAPQSDYQFKPQMGLPNELPSESQVTGQNEISQNEPFDLAPNNSFLDIDSFANSTDNGIPLSYTLSISGIDSGEMYQSLKDALTDLRFGWDAIEVVRAIKNGVLELHNLNPAVASLIARRLRGGDFKLSWKQNI